MIFPLGGIKLSALISSEDFCFGSFCGSPGCILLPDPRRLELEGWLDALE